MVALSVVFTVRFEEIIAQNVQGMPTTPVHLSAITLVRNEPNRPQTSFTSHSLLTFRLDVFESLQRAWLRKIGGDA
jgi:hypothetical protein